MSNVRVVNDDNFDAEVLKAEGPVLVDFWAPWCGPCRMVAPVLEKVSESYAGRVTVTKLNVDESPVTAQTYGIRSIPTVALFKDGEPVDGVVGAAPEAYFTKLLDKYLAPVGESA